jgi:CheY-like chemotaxis protein
MHNRNGNVVFVNLTPAGCPNFMHKTILVVEDERFSRDIILATLRACGFNCISAENGQDALNILSVSSCDLILTDLRMPILNGLDLISAIRNGKRAPRISRDIPIVVLSAEKGEMIDAAIDLGISCYFIKKEPIDNLVPKLKQLLEILD